MSDEVNRYILELEQMDDDERAFYEWHEQLLENAGLGFLIRARQLTNMNNQQRREVREQLTRRSGERGESA